MYISPDVYRYEYLKQRDKELVDIIEETKSRTMDDMIVEDFLEENQAVSPTMEKVYEECLKKFLSYQRERAEYFKVDIIVDAIEGYSDSEYEELRKIAAASASKTH